MEGKEARFGKWSLEKGLLLKMLYPTYTKALDTKDCYRKFQE
jgi:hypothetical protein